MKFSNPFSSLPPLWRLVCMALFLLFAVFSGIYFIFLPSRIFAAKAVFRYYPENKTDASLLKPAGASQNLPEYFFEKPSLYEKIQRALLKRNHIKVSSHTLSRSLRVQKKEKETEYTVHARHVDPGRAMAFLDAFLFVLIREVKESETGYLRTKKKIVEKQALQAEEELMALRKEINRSSGGVNAKALRDEIKRLQDEMDQFSLKKTESQEILRKLQSRLRREEPRIVSGTSVGANPAYKEAKFKLLDLQNALAKKKEDAKATPDELTAIEKQIRALTTKINTRIPKYVETPQMTANPVYEYLHQKIFQQQMMGSSLSLRLRTLQDNVRKQKAKALTDADQTGGSEKLVRDAQRAENRIYLLQGIVEDINLELLRPDSIMMISKSKKASVLRPLRNGEVLGWFSVFFLALLSVLKLAAQMRRGVLDFPEALQVFEIPVLLHHSGREQDNMYVARTLSCVCHEISLKSLLFLVSRTTASSAVCDIAVHLSQKAGRVLLVDADFHAPSLHDFFEVENDSGFYSILCSDAINPAGSEQQLIEKIEQYVVPVTAQCGFIGTGTGALRRVSLREKIRKENLEAFLRAIRYSDVILLFYATIDSSDSFTEFIPYIEGIVLCCPDGKEIDPRRPRFLSLMKSVQHKMIGSVLFPRHVRSMNAIPALFHRES